MKKKEKGTQEYEEGGKTKEIKENGNGEEQRWDYFMTKKVKTKKEKLH
jgi:hypothetical protein